MDIGGSQIVTTIASSTTNYFEVYAPVFLLVGGIVLAVGVVGLLIDMVVRKKEVAENTEVL
jgi:predicted membrane channel-forming protein YqfA (hemolysin III family)